jgi:hypothetical protein
MRTTTDGGRNGAQWSLTRQLEDLNFEDDLALLSYSQAQKQEKTATLNTIPQQVRLQKHSDKTKTMRLNTNNRESIRLGNIPLQEVDAFTFLGSVIIREDGTEAFITLKNI